MCFSSDLSFALPWLSILSLGLTLTGSGTERISVSLKPLLSLLTITSLGILGSILGISNF